MPKPKGKSINDIRRQLARIAGLASQNANGGERVSRATETATKYIANISKTKTNQNLMHESNRAMMRGDVEGQVENRAKAYGRRVSRRTYMGLGTGG